MIGFVRSRGQLDVDDLQVFNHGSRGGRYWYSRGWNINATAAWTLGSVAGVLSNSTESFTGPVAGWAHGIDLSVVSSAVTAAVLYLILERLRPSCRG